MLSHHHASAHGPCLRNLTLPLDLSSLTDASPLSSSSHCSLRRLEVFEPLSLPSELQEKYILTRNLIAMFPRLETITSPGGESDIKDLQVMLNILQGMVSFPPKRP